MLALLGYGTSWILVRFTDIISYRLAPFRSFDPALADATDEELFDLFGPVATINFGVTDVADPRSLLFAAAHSGSIAEILGGIGFTLVLLAGLSLVECFAAPVLAPLNNLGRMALAYYVGHILGLLVLLIVGKAEFSTRFGLLVFVVGLTAFATSAGGGRRQACLEHLPQAAS